MLKKKERRGLNLGKLIGFPMASQPIKTDCKMFRRWGDISV